MLCLIIECSTLHFHVMGVGTGGAAGAVAPATIKLGGGGGDVFSPPQLFATKLNSNFEVM